MAINLSIDNDRVTAGIQNLTIDQTAGMQAPPDGNDVNLTLVGQIDGFGPTAAVLDTGFETYLANLGLNTDQRNFAVLVDGSSSSSTFIQATATAGENFTDLRFNDPGASNLINGLQSLAGEPLYLHVDATGNFATVTTASGAGGRVVAAFALTNEVLNNVTHIATAGVQMVTLEPIKHTVTTNNDETLSFTDILQIGASATRSFDFDALQSGASLWCAVGNSSGAVLVTGRDAEVDADNKKTNDSDVIHTSQGGDGTTIGVNNQLFDSPGETAVITLVTGFTNLVGADAGATGVYTVDAKPNDPKPEGIDYSGYLNVTGAAVYLSQSQGNDPFDLDIVLWEAGGDAGGAQTAEDLTSYIPGLASDTAVNVASVTIRDDDGDVVGVWGLGGTLTSGQSVNGWVSTNGIANVTVTITGSTIQVEGVIGAYTVAWTSAAGETFNRFDVVGQGGQFDIGQVDITESLSSGTGLGSHLLVDDDGPSVDLVLNGAAELRLDETDNDADDNNVGGILATNTLAAASYLTTNTASFGTDGQAAANPTVWALTLTGANAAGVDSGLDDAATNSNVMLFLTNSTTIVGRVGGPAGAVVMTISINATTGALTVTQDRAVEHNDSGDHDEAGASSAMMNSGLVNAVRTVTDGDGDSASDNADVSQVIKLEDDGPSVDIALNTSAELRLDETDNDADDNAVGGILAGGSIAVGSYLSTNSASFGSDGQAAANPTAWSLTLTGANAAGVDSGLDDSITNSNVMLFQTNATTIVGRVGGPAGAVVMTVTINASTGELSVTQERGIEHNDSADPDEAGASSAVMNTGLIGAVRTVTDGDGDSASDSADVSRVIKLEDDGPGITGQPMGSGTPNNLVVGNTVGATDSSAYTLAGGADGAASFNFVGPADGSGDFTWAFFNVDGMNGIEQNEIRGFYNGNALYDLELNSDGTYAVTMLGTLPGSSLNLSTAEIKAGAPDTNSIEVGAAENDQFVRISGDSTVGAGNINESNAFVGVDNGNLDVNETLVFTLHNANGTLVNFTGMSIGTKSAQASDYHVVAHLVGGGVYEDDLTVAKNGTLVVDPPGNVLVSSIEVTKISGSATKIGVGDIEIFTLPNDVTLGFDVRLTDGDGDFVGQSFTLSIDGDNDGTITNPVQGLTALNVESVAGIEPLNFAYQTNDYFL